MINVFYLQIHDEQAEEKQRNVLIKCSRPICSQYLYLDGKDYSECCIAALYRLCTCMHSEDPNIPLDILPSEISPPDSSPWAISPSFLYGVGHHMVLVPLLSSRMLVFDRRAFAVLRSTYS